MCRSLWNIFFFAGFTRIVVESMKKYVAFHWLCSGRHMEMMRSECPICKFLSLATIEFLTMKLMP